MTVPEHWSDLMGRWGDYGYRDVPDFAIPAEQRCWRCVARPIHNYGTDQECAASLCEQCCTDLRSVA